MLIVYTVFRIMLLIILFFVSFVYVFFFFFFSSRRRHTRFDCDWSSDVCSSDLATRRRLAARGPAHDTVVLVDDVQHLVRGAGAGHLVRGAGAGHLVRGADGGDRKSVV